MHLYLKYQDIDSYFSILCLQLQVTPKACLLTYPVSINEKSFKNTLVLFLLGWKEAEYRMVHHRERLVARGIGADAIQPEWCHQNEGLCYVRKQ